jgi:hypothetical protein
MKYLLFFDIYIYIYEFSQTIFTGKDKRTGKDKGRGKEEKRGRGSGIGSGIGRVSGIQTERESDKGRVRRVYETTSTSEKSV